MSLPKFSELKKLGYVSVSREKEGKIEDLESEVVKINLKKFDPYTGEEIEDGEILPTTLKDLRRAKEAKQEKIAELQGEIKEQDEIIKEIESVLK